MRQFNALLTFAISALLLTACAAPLPETGRAYDATDPNSFRVEAVATDHEMASRAGALMLRAGGNAVDASVASSLTLSVVRPMSCGIGGGGFMVIVMPDDPIHGPVTTAFDYRERAPDAVDASFFENQPADASRHSGRAVGVPGTVAGLFAAHEKYGRLDWEDVCKPAIRVAREGWVVDAFAAEQSRALAGFLSTREDADPFMVETYAWLKEGSVVTNPAQADVLERVAKEGPSAFYEGDVARAIVESVRARGGVMTMVDLARCRPKEVEPIVGEVMGRAFVSMPLPSSGGVTMLAALSIFEQRTDLWGEADSPTDPVYAHALIESMKHAFADRAAHLGDPEYHTIPVNDLLNDEAIHNRARRIHPDRTFPPDFYTDVGQLPDDAGTSHVSVVDRWGNAVAMTETINLSFGAKFTAAGMGFALNNEMDDFLARRGTVNAFGLVQSARNLPQAGKRPLSSTSPMIVLSADGRRVDLVAGASGGPRIITSTMQAVLNALHFKMGARDAVMAPRLHHQWVPDAVYVETFAPLDAETRAALRELGHEIREREAIGNVQMITRVDGGYEAMSDPRKGGAPSGR